MPRPASRGQDAPRAVTRPPNDDNDRMANQTRMHPELLKIGLQLQAFLLERPLSLRTITGGRQCLKRFAEHHQPHESTSFPTEWLDNTGIAGRVLTKWIHHKNNPFRIEDGVGDVESDREGTLEEELGADHVVVTTRQSVRASQRAENNALKDLIDQVRRLTMAQSELNATIRSMKGVIERQEKELWEVAHQLSEGREQARRDAEALQEEIRQCNATIKQLTTAGRTWASVATAGNNQFTSSTTPSQQPKPLVTPATLPGVNVDLSSMPNPPPELRETRVIRQSRGSLESPRNHGEHSLRWDSKKGWGSSQVQGMLQFS